MTKQYSEPWLLIELLRARSQHHVSLAELAAIHTDKSELPADYHRGAAQAYEEAAKLIERAQKTGL